MPEPPTDRDILAALAKEDFQGPMWDRFAQDLATFGIGVMRGWIMSGRIYEELRARNIHHSVGGGQWGALTLDEATTIAVETTARAIVSYRDMMLLNGWWSPEDGDSITASFITQCLIQFPLVYRWWVPGRRRREDH